MHEIERYQHFLHAKTNGFKWKVERTETIIDEATALDVRFYCAFSGGVDSGAMLDMLYRAGHRLDVRWSDGGGPNFPEMYAHLREMEERYNFHLHRVHNLNSWRSWCIEMGRPDLIGCSEVWPDTGSYDSVRTSREHEEWKEGYGGVFLGLLASESRSRSYALKDGWKPLYQVKSEHGMWHCSPLAHFTKQDVWSYIVSRELPYNPVYDKLAELGVSLERRRVAPLTCFRTVQYGSVVVLKQGWPELFNKLAALFPKVREYV